MSWQFSDYLWSRAKFIQFIAFANIRHGLAFTLIRSRRIFFSALNATQNGLDKLDLNRSYAGENPSTMLSN